MSERTRILRHLDEHYTEPYRDPIWQHIYLSPALTRMTQTSSFQQLHGIRQLGPAYLVYPGATHTRFSHSLGVFHIARRMITQLVKRDTCPPVDLVGVKAFLCASLLHDLGHYPFAHSLKDLSLENHEKLTAKIILERDEIATVIQKHLEVPPALVASIIDLRSTSTSDERVSFFRNILSGVLDPDKLDYLNRDAYFCGVPYGIQDTDFILRQVMFHPPQGIGISKKGIAAVESLLFSKYLMYRHVYWHRDVRIATAMIKKAILMGLEAGIIQPCDLYEIDDSEFFRLLGSRDFPPFELARRVARNDLYACITDRPFEIDTKLHRQLEDVGFRLRFEADFAAASSETGAETVDSEEIIVDIPERFSFEIDLCVLDRGKSVPYKQAGSVFSEDVVSGFAHNLRTITLLAPAHLKKTLERSNPNLLLKGR